RTRQRVRDQHHLEAPVAQRSHRQADTVHGDRPLGYQERLEVTARQRNPHPCRRFYTGYGVHGSHTIDVPQDQVAAQGAAETEGSLEIDAIAGGQVTERGAGKGFRTDLEDEAGGAGLDHSQAHPVDRDAATDLDAVERGARLDLEPRKLRALLDRADRADFLDDAREHQALRGSRTTSASTRRSSPRGVTVKLPRRTALL